MNATASKSNRSRWLILAGLGLVALAEPRLGFVVGLTVANLLVREQFPFSNFPMYSRFSERTFYLYITNESDEPIPFRHFSFTSTGLAKVYLSIIWANQPKANVTKMSPAQLEDAGREVVQYLKSRPRKRTDVAGFEALRLYQVNLTLRAGQVHEETVLIAEA